MECIWAGLGLAKLTTILLDFCRQNGTARQATAKASGARFTLPDFQPDDAPA